MTLFSPGTRVTAGGNVRPRSRGKGFAVVTSDGELFGLLPSPDTGNAGFDTYWPSLPPDATNRTLLVDHATRKMFWGQPEHASLGSLDNDDHPQYFNDDRLGDWLDGISNTALGVSRLDGGGKIPVEQLPNAVMTYVGTWNAATNSPFLVDGDGENAPEDIGDVYRVTVAGTQDMGSGPQDFAVGDHVILSYGFIWQRASATDAVSSVNGLTGDVDLQTGDINETPGSEFYSYSLFSADFGADFSGAFNTAFGGKSTTDLAEGSNLYYTTARFDTALATKSTTNLAEGTNLYYTAARFNTAFGGKSTTDLAEGTNLYHTTARARAAISAGTGIGYSSSTGVVSNSGVTSITGTANQIVRDSATGAVTLSLPQSIDTGASPTFAGMTLSGTASGLLLAERTGLTSDAFDSPTTNNVMAVRAKKSTDMSYGFGPTLLFQAQDDTSGVVTAGCIASRWAAAGDASFDMVFHAGGSPRMTLAYNGRLGVGITNNLLAYFHAGAGTASVAPIKLTNGTNLTTPLSGAIEYDNTFLFTQSDGTRRNVMLANTSAPDTFGAPFTNTGKKTVRIGGTDFTFMTCAP